MVVPRKWKFVAGTMSAAVALGAGAAVAQEAGEETDPDNQSVLTEVIDIEELPKLDIVGDSVLPQVEDEADVDSPFDSVSDQSVSLESEASVSDESESLPSEDSVSDESESLPSEDSVSDESESLPSEDSVSSESAE